MLKGKEVSWGRRGGCASPLHCSIRLAALDIGPEDSPYSRPGHPRRRQRLRPAADSFRYEAHPPRLPRSTSPEV